MSEGLTVRRRGDVRNPPGLTRAFVKAPAMSAALIVPLSGSRSPAIRARDAAPRLRDQFISAMSRMAARLAAVDCRAASATQLGTHHVLTGAVETIQLSPVAQRFTFFAQNHFATDA